MMEEQEDKPKSRRGGWRPNSGRPKKSDEKAMLDSLGKHIKDEEVFKVLKKLIAKGDTRAITIYMNYKYGKPVDRQDIKTDNMNIDLSVSKTYDSVEEIMRAQERANDLPDNTEDDGTDESFLKIV